MAISPSDLLRAAQGPINARVSATSFEADTSDDSITLSAGAYELFNESTTILAWLQLGAVAAIPADKAALVTGLFFLPPGGVDMLVLDAETALHAITASSSAVIRIAKKAV